MALSLLVIVANVCPTMAQQTAHKSHVPLAMLAPADRYFGPLKMSILGINNALTMVKRRQAGGDISDSTIASLTQVNLSIREWEQQFPRDPWISRAVLALHKTYALFPDAKAQAHAAATAAWLASKYPDSKEAGELRVRLAESAQAGSSAAIK
ncbi:MAG: hypothetical protein NVSMB19_24470 [Vulcanimicrobiaceae bacterium]